MKHPLTSKERRGLVAVAAAALLCLSLGFIFRNCGSRNSSAAHQVVIVNNDSVTSPDASRDSVSEKSVSGTRKRKKKSDDSEKHKRSKKAKKQKAEKVYPTRSPLDEPCDSY
ncbi:MAG: hypothetical protein K2H72_07570 [Muribaculaceae bacterium]|nr:hypothetical protein [Muribaculaceae bacterium]